MAATGRARLRPRNMSFVLLGGDSFAAAVTPSCWRPDVRSAGLARLWQALELLSVASGRSA